MTARTERQQQRPLDPAIARKLAQAHAAYLRYHARRGSIRDLFAQQDSRLRGWDE